VKKIIKNVNINYEYNDNGFDTTIIFLHGWGQNIEMMKPIADKYQNNYNTFILDLPGFGKSSEPEFSWELIDYVDLVRKIKEIFNFKKIIIIGHSFGGRVALLYSSLYEVEKLICLASPYCPEITKLPLKNRIYKKLKKISCLKWLADIMKNYVGSSDYNNASEIMKGVLVKAINTNLTNDVKKIKCPTLLIWGELDTAVPVKRAYELEKLIKDAGVVVYKDATHYAYLERLNEVILVLDSFLKVRR